MDLTPLLFALPAAAVLLALGWRPWLGGDAPWSGPIATAVAVPVCYGAAWYGWNEAWPSLWPAENTTGKAWVLPGLVVASLGWLAPTRLAVQVFLAWVAAEVVVGAGHALSLAQVEGDLLPVELAMKVALVALAVSLAAAGREVLVNEPDGPVDHSGPEKHAVDRVFERPVVHAQDPPAGDPLGDSALPGTHEDLVQALEGVPVGSDVASAHIGPATSQGSDHGDPASERPVGQYLGEGSDKGPISAVDDQQFDVVLGERRQRFRHRRRRARLDSGYLGEAFQVAKQPRRHGVTAPSAEIT